MRLRRSVPGSEVGDGREGQMRASGLQLHGGKGGRVRKVLQRTLQGEARFDRAPMRMSAPRVPLESHTENASSSMCSTRMARASSITPRKAGKKPTVWE